MFLFFYVLIVLCLLFKNSFTLQNIMFFNKKICTKICKKVCIKVCMNYKKGEWGVALNPFCLVLVVGLEPTRSPTRPLNVRVCHSATPASMDYVSIIFFCCQEILKKNLLLVSWKKQTNPKESLVHLAQLLHHTFRKYSHVHLP